MIFQQIYSGKGVQNFVSIARVFLKKILQKHFGLFFRTHSVKLLLLLLLLLLNVYGRGSTITSWNYCMVAEMLLVDKQHATTRSGVGRRDDHWAVYVHRRRNRRKMKDGKYAWWVTALRIMESCPGDSSDLKDLWVYTTCAWRL